MTFVNILEKDIQDVVTTVRGKLTKLLRLTIGAMLTLDVHGKEIIKDLHRDKVCSVEDFDWVAQLRYV